MSLASALTTMKSICGAFAARAGFKMRAGVTHATFFVRKALAESTTVGRHARDVRSERHMPAIQIS